jgi:3-deoxy-D-manno-octulosonic-acid transferase
MTYLLNLVYLLTLLIFSPWLLYKALTTGKYRRGMWRKLSGRAFLRLSAAPCAWFHGVSVGEVHLLRQVVACFRRRHPTWECVISTTTDTGFEEATKRFPDLPVFYWPLDFSWAVHRALRRIKPNLIILAEGELWPNFLAAASQRDVPVAVINARMSPRSAQRHRRLRWLTRRLWNRIAVFGVQTEEYAAAYRALSVAASPVHVTGNVKYDGVESDRGNTRTERLRRLLGVQPNDLIWIAGSTQAPEEEIVLAIFRRLRAQFPNLRLFLVPRQKDRFDGVAALIQSTGQPFLRRSEISDSPPVTQSSGHPVTLVDTIGELGALWGLADVAFVGGSLDGRRGGQNMIEPAAYGAAVVFGPHVWNFRDTAERLVMAGGALQIADSQALEQEVTRLLANPAERARLGKAARAFVAAQQGATEKTVELLNGLLLQNVEKPCAA